MMYDEDENMPLFMLWLWIFFTRLFRLNKPLWKLFILKRNIETKLGIRKIQEWLYKRKISKNE